MTPSTIIKNILGPERTLKLLYLLKQQRFLSINNPKRLSEKIIYRRLYPQKVFSILSDKAFVRDYVREKIGEEFLVPVYQISERLTREIWDNLPNAFIIKTNHGAGFNYIVKNKYSEEFEKVINIINSWLEIDFSKIHFEMHYQDIKPKIIIEKLLINNGEDLRDYKVHVFNNPNNQSCRCFVQIISDRNSLGPQKRLWLSEDLSLAPFQQKGYPLLDNSIIQEDKKSLSEVMHLARKLTSKMHYCRVDFYIADNQIFFGEMTFTPHGGNILFNPNEWDLILGQFFAWPEPEYEISEL